MSFLKRKSLFFILIGIILMVVLIGYSLTNKDKFSTPEKLVKDSVGWVQGIAYKPVDFIVDSISNLQNLKMTYDENQVLREKITEYKTLAFENRELEKENDELRKALDLNESKRDYNSINATVIARSPERWLEQITINRGKKHGIEENMAVITAEGKIGKTQKASHLTSTVQLLTGFDNLNSISAMVKREKGAETFGLIERYDQDTDSLVFRVIEDSKQELKEGEQVFSSNLGGSYPADILIGEIKEVVQDQYGLTKTALIKPSANVNDLNNVIVVDRSLLTSLEIDKDEVASKTSLDEETEKAIDEDEEL